jgi:2-polyprenyl-3-methyl-5-hydroxy-6-metoxy-1,4-benzoquinol methylase
LDKSELAELPPELAERIREEAGENDDIYRRRSVDLNLSRIHYFHLEMLNWAIRQLGDLNGARILDVGIGDGHTSVLMARAGAQVTGIEFPLLPWTEPRP